MQDYENVFDRTCDLKGKWSSYFGNDGAIVLEVGCGKAAYTTGLAELYPARNIIGIDRKADRIWVGATYARDNALTNAAFLYISMRDLPSHFAPGEVSEIWITFPDPFEGNLKTTKRLTSEYYLSRYQQVLAPGGKIHLKTDSVPLYDYSLAAFDSFGAHLDTSLRDIYSHPDLSPELLIQTPFEKKYIALKKPINYASWHL